jgi:hypothetical protein
MLTIKFPRHDPSSRTLDASRRATWTHTAPAQPGNGEPGVACSASDFPHTGPRLREHLAASLFASWQTFEISREDRIGRSGRPQIADESGIP